jgi:hypothetical protein
VVAGFYVATISHNINNVEGSHESGLTDGIQNVPSSGIPTTDHASPWAGCYENGRL